MELIKSGYGTFEQGQQLGPICWPHFDLFTVHQGVVMLNIEGQLHTLGSNTSILIPANSEFHGETREASLASVFHFKLDQQGYAHSFAHLNKLLTLGAKPQVFELSDIIHRDIKRCLNICGSEASGEINLSFFSFVLAELMHGSAHNDLPEPNGKFKQLLKDIDKHITEEHNVSYWAQQVNMSESHFRYEFKKQVGLSLVNYKNQKKIALACELLEQSNVSIQQIAYNLGFGELASFYRLFKKVTQQTPKQFRQSRQVFY